MRWLAVAGLALACVGCGSKDKVDYTAETKKCVTQTLESKKTVSAIRDLLDTDDDAEVGSFVTDRCTAIVVNNKLVLDEYASTVLAESQSYLSTH